MRYSIIYLVLSMMVLQACTEPYIPKTENFEDLLVVEATITNELKAQKIKLSRTFRFEKKQPEIVKDAELTVYDNLGNNYSFEYAQEDSLYVSTTEFQALPEVEYTLNILTNDGETYISEPEVLPSENNVSVDYTITEVGGQYGVQIVANSYDPTNSSHYYRYEYEETYKVIVPLPGNYKAVLYEVPLHMSLSGYYIGFELRDDPQTRICYVTKYSDGINLTNTSNKSEDRVIDFPIRFIQPDNYILNYKYSILVKQYVESYEAHIFHKTLKKIAGTEGNILSPNQPGFVTGNLSAINGNKKIIGYFEIASVSSERIFLDHATLFPNIPLPDYFQECDIEKLSTRPPLNHNGNPDHNKIIAYIHNGTKLLYKVLPDGTFNIFWMVPPECTDCTSFASNEIPDFW